MPLLHREDETFRMGRPPDPSEEDAPLTPGMEVGAYRVVRQIGSGGHGTVYLAEQPALGLQVAIKVLRRDLLGSAEMVARFAREVRVVSALRHPSLVAVLDAGVLPDGRPYYAMELLTGRSLVELIRDRGPLAAPVALALLAPVCEALAAVHQSGVVHRDVKASNVMVVAEGSPPEVRLLDFGVARAPEAVEAGITTTTQRIGSSGARAPEQILAGPVDARTDVYALGVLLHHILTGHLPFEASDPAEVDRMHLEAEPPRASAVAASPVALDAVVARAMAKAPGDRYPSALAFLDAARQAAGEGASAGVRRVPALAIHVGFRPESSEPDEATLLAQADAVGRAESDLVAAGYTIGLATSGEVLGIRLLAADAAAAGAEALAFARSLPRRLALPGLRVSVMVHADAAEVRQTPGGPEIAGGPVCETARWVPEDGPEFAATPEALAGC
jgi:eukaryotic-like serine/threonine-protein kinase